eukprot:scaffold14901_cov67-Phaeocystis_antarctica.AAC.3
MSSGGLLTPNDGLEGKFDVLLQDRYRFSGIFLGALQEPPPRATHITKVCPAAMHSPPARATTPAHDHATSPLHAHAHSTSSSSCNCYVPRCHIGGRSPEQALARAARQPMARPPACTFHAVPLLPLCVH